MYGSEDGGNSETHGEVPDSLLPSVNDAMKDCVSCRSFTSNLQNSNQPGMILTVTRETEQESLSIQRRRDTGRGRAYSKNVNNIDDTSVVLAHDALI